jgi:hypothetical protein
MSRVVAGLTGAALLAAACASLPEPKGEVANADLALRKAEAVNAAEFAPLDARLAREKLEGARLAVRDENYLKARRLAEAAEVDALVAEAKARSTRVQRSTQEVRDQVEKMRGEADRAAEHLK